MHILDKIEINYTRQAAKIKLYDNTIVEATVYTRLNENNKASEENKPPTERYI